MRNSRGALTLTLEPRAVARPVWRTVRAALQGKTWPSNPAYPYHSAWRKVNPQWLDTRQAEARGILHSQWV